AQVEHDLAAADVHAGADQVALGEAQVLLAQAHLMAGEPDHQDRAAVLYFQVPFRRRRRHEHSLPGGGENAPSSDSRVAPQISKLFWCGGCRWRNRSGSQTPVWERLGRETEFREAGVPKQEFGNQGKLFWRGGAGGCVRAFWQCRRTAGVSRLVETAPAE